MTTKIFNADGTVTYEHVIKRMRRDGTYSERVGRFNYTPKKRCSESIADMRKRVNTKRLTLKREVQNMDDEARLDFLSKLLCKIGSMDVSKVDGIYKICLTAVDINTSDATA